MWLQGSRMVRLQRQYQQSSDAHDEWWNRTVAAAAKEQKSFEGQATRINILVDLGFGDLGSLFPSKQDLILYI